MTDRKINLKYTVLKDVMFDKRNIAGGLRILIENYTFFILYLKYISEIFYY